MAFLAPFALPALRGASEHPVQTFRAVFQVAVGGAAILEVILWPIGRYRSTHPAPPYDTAAPGWGGGGGASSSSGGSTAPGSGGSLAKGATILDVVKKAGWPQSQWAECCAVIYRESGAKANAAPWTMGSYFKDVNYYRGDPSIGLMQIVGSNVVNLHEASSLQEAQKKLMDPLFNVQFGLKLWKMYGWGPWTTSKGWQPYVGHENDKITGY